jgi:FlaA1/EpsC-like NDP-sugar epimerase
VTITHPDIRRYFMLIPEAVQLVLQAAAAADPGAVYVLDMGEQIRLVDMARNLIRLSGHVPGEDVDVVFTGLRPGEKLSEELIADDEVPDSGPVPKILRLRSRTRRAPVLASPELALMLRASAKGDDAMVLQCMRHLVPSFTPVNHGGVQEWSSDNRLAMASHPRA